MVRPVGGAISIVSGMVTTVGDRLQWSLGLGELMGTELGFEEYVTTRTWSSGWQSWAQRTQVPCTQARREWRKGLGPGWRSQGFGGARVVGWFSLAWRKEARREERVLSGEIADRLLVRLYLLSFCFQNFGCMIRS